MDGESTIEIQPEEFEEPEFSELKVFCFIADLFGGEVQVTKRLGSHDGEPSFIWYKADCLNVDPDAMDLIESYSFKFLYPNALGQLSFISGQDPKAPESRLEKIILKDSGKQLAYVRGAERGITVTGLVDKGDGWFEFEDAETEYRNFCEQFINQYADKIGENDGQ